MRADQVGWDLMEITAHSGARPGHARWQGKIVSRSGKRGYLTLRDIGYGDVTGFKGINCNHDWHPYFPGSARTYSNKQLKALENEKVTYNGQKITKYEATQIQRKMERQIRKDKRDVAGLQGVLKSNVKDSKLIEDTKRKLIDKQSTLKQDNALLNDFVKQTGARKDYSRLSVIKNEKNYKLGNTDKKSIGGTGEGKFFEKIKKSEIKSKLKKYENDIREKKKEFGFVIDKNNNVYKYSGDETNLSITDIILDGAIITHNHPEIASFGEDDFYMIQNNQKIKELRAVDNKYDYSLKLLKPIDISYNEAYRYGLEIAMETGDEIQHCVMLYLKKKGYIKYERKQRF